MGSKGEPPDVLLPSQVYPDKVKDIHKATQIPARKLSEYLAVYSVCASACFGSHMCVVWLSGSGHHILGVAVWCLEDHSATILNLQSHNHSENIDGEYSLVAVSLTTAPVF